MLSSANFDTERTRRELNASIVAWSAEPSQRTGLRNDDAANCDRLVVSGARRLYDLGARSFLFLTTPPVELTPQGTLPHEGGYNDRHITAAATIMLNDYLKAAVIGFETDLTEANAMVFDSEAFFRLLVGMPEAFGLTDPVRYVFDIQGYKAPRGRMGFM